MMRLVLMGCRAVIALVFCGLHAFSFAQSDNVPRTALIIGNAAYTKPDASLKNSVSDARLMAQTLKDLGFEVMLREDVDRRAMQAAFREFQDAVRKKKGIAVFYFAGHGVQVAGRNYIVPIGAHLVRDVDARDSALDVDVMLQGVRDTGAQLNLFILDACRNNPLLATQRGEAGKVSAGLAAMRPPAGALIAFATEPGRVAADGKEAGHGLYTKHLAKWLKEPNLTLEQVFKRTREAVKVESGDTQIPTEYSLLTGADFYLSKATPRAADKSPVQGAKNLGMSRESGIDVKESVAPRSVSQARKDLVALGAKFDTSDFFKAIDADDVLLVSAFVDARYKFGSGVIWRWLRFRYTDVQYLDQFPKNVMQYFVDNFQATGIEKKYLCGSEADKEALEDLTNGQKIWYSLNAIYTPDEAKRMLQIRHEFYFKFCGVKLG
jgi:uncharacterized caspase-like protein